MKKFLIKFLMYITHLITNILIQGMLWGILIFFASTPIADTVIILVLLIADYVINMIIQRKPIGELRFKKLFHLLDLLLAVPGVWVVVREIIKIVSGITQNYNAAEITTCIFVLAVNALLLTERILLIRKSNWKKVLYVFVISVVLVSAVCILYNTWTGLKADKLYQEYVDTLDTADSITPCYGYLRMKESECFVWTSQSGEQVCGMRNMKTGEERIYFNGTCFFYESSESEPKLHEAVIPYEETMNRITKMIYSFSEEMVLSSSLYHRTASFGCESLPFFWEDDSQLLELKLTDQADSFTPDEHSWAHIVLYPDESSIFTYNLTPSESTNDNECIFLAIGRQKCELTKLYGWQGHILPEWQERQ